MDRDVMGKINPWTLTIRQEPLENEYRSYSITEAIMQFRYAFSMGVFLFIFFIWVDRQLFVDVAGVFLRIRLYLAMPVLLLSLISTFFPWYVKYARAINLTAVMTAGLSIILLAVMGSAEPNVGILHYYMYMVFFFLFSFFKMPYRDALVVGIVLTGGILTVDFFLCQMPIHTFIFYLMVMIVGNVVGVSIAYVMEYQSKKEFLLKRRLSESVIKDALTGLYNRHYFDQILVRDLEDFILRSKGVRHVERRLGDIKTAKYGLFMVDIDYFKRINDTFGHQSGDMVLQEFAKLLKDNVRRTDDVLRVGGEEFLIVLKLTTDDYLIRFMKKLGKAIEDHDFRIEGGAIIGCTASMGLIALPNSRTDDPLELINFADRALYRSKDRGRNRGHRAYELQGELEFEEILWD